MNAETTTAMLPYLLGLGGPFIAAILNDPRPYRRWLRLLISVLVVTGSVLIQLWQQGGSYSVKDTAWTTFVIALTNQGTFRFLRDAFLGKLEVASGNGLGGIIDSVRAAVASNPQPGVLDVNMAVQNVLSSSDLTPEQMVEAIRGLAGGRR